jgi:hypothetical protein
MKKFKLELDTLAVQSFAADPEPARRGTVAAHQETGWGATCGLSCYPGINTNCVCEPDTYGETWNVGTCQTGECQCYNTAGDPTCTGSCCG